MRVYKTKPFARFQRRERIDDETLCTTLADVEAGLLEADLGGGLIKQRVARTGSGKRGGYRTVIAYRKATRAFFLLGFAKSARANIGAAELAALKRQAAALLAAADQALDAMVASNDLTEVDCGESTQD
ncbi:MAG: type II toxin-antitoxin system RelE/ParE family toxin [Hyphomicrobiales bacterium]|nr:type II toxin-antitoxin system RelE/ParE family toxin [Hyphomicrobiales bacterium]